MATAAPKASKPEEKRRSGPEPVLRISTVIERDSIEIDGTFYEMPVARDFSIVEQQILSRDGRVFRDLWNKPEELDDDEQKQLKQLLDRTYLKVKPIGWEGELDDESRASIVLTFTMAPLMKAAREQAQREAAEAEARESSTTAS